MRSGVGTVSFCERVSILGVAHYAGTVCANCHVVLPPVSITVVIMAQNAAAETGGDGSVGETKDDAEYEDTNNHDEKKTSFKTSLLNKFDRTRNFVWDSSTKQFLGRTWISWGTFTRLRSFIFHEFYFQVTFSISRRLQLDCKLTFTS